MDRRTRNPLASALHGIRCLPASLGLATLLPLLAALAAPPAAAAPLAAADHLVISQFVVKTRVPYATFGSPFVAVTNPTAGDLDLSHVYLTDATLMPGTLYTNLTLNNPAVAPPGGGSGGDFNAKFPDGYVLPAGATVAIALAGSAQYLAAYGRLPDLELFEDEYYVADTVAEMDAAFPGAINAVGIGGGTNVPALSDVSESLVLYSWDGHSELVQDLDYVIWGTNTTVRVDKTGRTVGGSTYLNDTPVASQVPAAAAGPTFGHALRRNAGYDEGAEVATGGNGAGGHDETSENLSATWADVVGSTPPPAPAVPFPSAPIFTASAHAPATPWEGLAVPLTAKVFSNSALTNVTFHYNVDGGAYADSVGVYMGSNTWTAIVPPQPGNAVVTWYCTATNAAGRTASVPVAAPRYTKGWTVATSPPADALRKPPYLVWPGDPTKMQVLWQTAASWPCSIQWGTDTNYGLGSVQTSEFGDDHQHAYMLTGLSPGQKYFYRVMFGATAYAGSFWTAPAAGATRLKFIAYGDTRTYPSVHDAVVGQMMHSIDVDPERQTLIVSVGDMVTDGDLESYWDNEYFAAVYGNLRRMSANVPFQACMGNHEGTGTLFQKYFPYPYVAARYWSFDYGPAHFAYVDQYVDYSPGSPQYEWLRNDLMTASSPWRFVVLHEPGWSADGGHENNLQVQAWLQPLFEQFGVSLVFGGHNHFYARAVVNGVQHITTGGGGAPLYTPDLQQPNLVVAVSTNQYSRITIDGTRLGFAAVNGTTVLDTFTIDKAAGVDPTPRAATTVTLAAVPNPFNPTTTLRYDLPAAGPARLAVYDLSGRCVRVLRDGGLPAGSGEASWDGRDASGRAVASGTYVAQLQAAGAAVTTRLSLVR